MLTKSQLGEFSLYDEQIWHMQIDYIGNLRFAISRGTPYPPVITNNCGCGLKLNSPYLLTFKFYHLNL